MLLAVSREGESSSPFRPATRFFIKMKLLSGILSKLKSPFPSSESYALESSKDDDERDEGWQEDMENRRAIFNQMEGHLLGMRQSSLEKSDELIIALSSGFLALSIGFIKEIVPLERSILMPMLVVSWVCFFAATVVNFFSHSMARRAIENQRECSRLYCLEGRTKYLKPEMNPATRSTENYNSCAAGLLAAGIVLTLIFVSVNVMREQSFQVSKANEPTQTSEQTKVTPQ